MARQGFVYRRNDPSGNIVPTNFAPEKGVVEGWSSKGIDGLIMYQVYKGGVICARVPPLFLSY